MPTRPEPELPDAARAVGALLAPVVACLRGDDAGVRLLLDDTCDAGAASGGIWKTTDGGIHWTPIFDDQMVSSVGALAVAPSDPNIVWAGTGEPWIRSHISIGNGVWKSTDAGENWTDISTNTGLPSGLLGNIGLAVSPINSNIVWAMIENEPAGGLYKSSDAGAGTQPISGTTAYSAKHATLPMWAQS